jgi:hypothetical protein
MYFVDNAIRDPVCEDHPFATATTTRRQRGESATFRRPFLPASAHPGRKSQFDERNVPLPRQRNESEFSLLADKSCRVEFNVVPKWTLQDQHAFA